MPRPKNAMEIFTLLDKSNCRECGEMTCLAFACAVYQGRRQIKACPKLDRIVIEKFSDTSDNRKALDQNGDEYLESLKREIGSIDLAAAAERIGAIYSVGKLTLKVLGKNFSVDNQGNLSSDIHINPWVAIPVIDYICSGQGLNPSGRWVSLRELKDGKERYPLFHKRCEEPMKRVADIYTDLFDDLVRIFGGKQVEQQFESDISVVLHPLPKVPLMICYWRPEDDLESDLNLFFDDTADKNLTIGSVFTLGAGLSQMLDKLALRHGFPEVESVGY
jgi:hypothetical protein